jgi:hypothetical protein
VLGGDQPLLVLSCFQTVLETTVQIVDFQRPRYLLNGTLPTLQQVPLPPQGKVEVKFGFMSDVHCTISRPAPNELPLAKFSFRPIFTTLSISNILVLFGCLLQETKVALVSRRYGLLTPCAEAFGEFSVPLRIGKEPISPRCDACTLSWTFLCSTGAVFGRSACSVLGGG